MSKHVLITKLASMGDIIHTLPALSDAKNNIPDIVFDWVVDTSFQEIPHWHSSVHETIITNHRKWRKKPFSQQTLFEFQQARKSLKKQPYDLIIDAHGNFKSALLARCSHGPIVGFNGASIPEWGAHFLYTKSYFVDKSLHAVQRLRSLFAQALDYEEPTSFPDYQIDNSKLSPPPCSLPSSYIVFVPIASKENKLWEEEHWKAVIAKCSDLGLPPIYIPWASSAEYERAKRLCTVPSANLLPKLSLSQIAHIILHAQALVSLDTGLSHIAAALSTPCLSLYGPTDPQKTGTIGKNQVWLSSPSLQEISPSAVFDQLQRLCSLC